MNRGLLAIERLVLESLAKDPLTVDEISFDTHLNTMLVSSIVSQFFSKGYLKFSKGKYEIDEKAKPRWLPAVNRKEVVKEEVKEIFSSLVNQHFECDDKNKMDRSGLRLKKIWLTPAEEKIFNSLLYNIDNFFQNVQRDRRVYPRKERTGEQKVVFWGASNYARLVDNLI